MWLKRDRLTDASVDIRWAAEADPYVDGADPPRRRIQVLANTLKISMENREDV